MLSSVIMQPIALLTVNQKWEMSFKIIDSRKFGVVQPIKMIVDSCNGRDLQFSWGLLVLINCSVTFYWIFF